MPSANINVVLQRLVELNDRAERLEAQLGQLLEELRTAISCEECQRTWLDGERGWQAHRVDLDVIAFYCPECAEREFSDA